LKRTIDPTGYRCVGFMDAHYPQQTFAVVGPGIVLKIPDDAEFAAMRENFHAQSRELFGTEFPPRKCAHCGKTRLRWIVAVEGSQGEREAWGDTCATEADLRDFPALEAYRAKKAAESLRSKAAIVKARQKFEDENPGFSAALIAHTEAGATRPVDLSFVGRDVPLAQRGAIEGQSLFSDNGFLADLVAKLNRYGNLSDKQVAAARTAMQRDRERAIKLLEWAAEPKTDAPEGRTRVRGQVVSIKEYESDWGINYKATVKCDGYAVWLTVPAGADFEKGDVIEVTATLTRSDRDKSFAFGKRPTKVEVIERAKA